MQDGSQNNSTVLHKEMRLDNWIAMVSNVWGEVSMGGYFPHISRLFVV
jgi:hypothetical protein